MTDIPQFSYSLLWLERTIISVANLTRRDADEFLLLAPKIDLRAQITTYGLANANDAIAELRSGRLKGAAVLIH